MTAWGSAQQLLTSARLDDCAGILKRLVLKGVGGVALSPVGHVLAAWVPEAKGVPGFVGLWDHRQLTSAGDAPTALSRKSFFRVRATVVLGLEHDQQPTPSSIG